MAGRIPERFIDALLLRVDVVELIDSYVPLRRMGKDYKACCPFHEEKTPSFTVSQDKQFYHCFGCGAHGTAIGFLMEYERMSFREAVEDLAGRAGMPIPEEARDRERQVDAVQGLLETLASASRYYQKQLREPAARDAVDYLKGRGLSGEIAAQFGLGFAPDGWDGLSRTLGSGKLAQDLLYQAGLTIKKEGGGYYDRFRNRVMFPIQDYRGRIIGFGGRVLGKGEPKYLNSPETALFHKGRELYGLYRARDAIKREQRVLVVEGYMDVVALAQFGIDNAVATLGTATTREHLERLFRFAPEIVFCFDGDRAGREAAWRALENAMPIIHEGRQVSFLFLPEGEDPDTLVRSQGEAGFRSLLKSALSLPDFLFQTLAARVDMGRLDGRAALVELARPLLAPMAPGVLREMLSARLAELSRLETGKLTTLLYKNEQKQPARGEARGARATNGRPSLVRNAIAMLIQHPGLAQQVSDATAFAALQMRGAPLLIELIQLLKTEPGLNTAGIIQRFRESEHAQTLAKLAAWDYPGLIPDVPAEFTGLVEQLHRLAATHAIDELSNEPDLQGLSETEKAEKKAKLRRLFEEKRKLTRPKN